LYAIDPKTQGPSDGGTTCKKIMGIEIKKPEPKKKKRLLTIGEDDEDYDDDDLMGFEPRRNLLISPKAKASSNSPSKISSKADGSDVKIKSNNVPSGEEEDNTTEEEDDPTSGILGEEETAK
jgi:hypothetical protein